MATLKGMNVRSTVKGVEDLVKTMRALGQTVNGRVSRKAITAGCKPVLKQVKATTPPDRSGALRKSHKISVSTSRKGAAKGHTLGKVGPEWKFTSQWQGKRVRPQKYAHLVEWGRKRVNVVKAQVFSPTGKKGGKTYGRSAKPVAGLHFMRRAWAQSEAAANAAIVGTLRVEIAKEAALAASKQRKP